MRWQTARTWAPRALTASARPSPMRTRAPSCPPRCTRTWRRTVASRPRCTTPKMAVTGQNKCRFSHGTSCQAEKIGFLNLHVLSRTSSHVIHLSWEADQHHDDVRNPPKNVRFKSPAQGWLWSCPALAFYTDHMVHGSLASDTESLGFYVGQQTGRLKRSNRLSPLT